MMHCPECGGRGLISSEERAKWDDREFTLRQLRAQRDGLLAAAKKVAGFAVACELTPGDISELLSAIARVEEINE